MSDNPFTQVTPEGPNASSREEALAKVKTPATLLLLTGILSIVGAIGYAGLISQAPDFLQTLITQMQQGPDVPDPEAIQQLEQAAQQVESLAGLYYAQALIGLFASGLMCFGALKMRKLQSFGLSMTACILAIVPFTSPCCSCIFPVAIGIWGIAVLVKEDVKTHFS